MTRRVEHRDNGNALRRGILNNFIHVRLGQERAVRAFTVAVSIIAVFQRSLHLIAGVCAHRHFIQQEAETVVSERQLQMRIV